MVVKIMITEKKISKVQRDRLLGKKMDTETISFKSGIDRKKDA